MIVQDRIARETGGRVTIVDATEYREAFDPAEGGRWVTTCERHGTFCQHERLEDARYYAAHPKVWCELCAEGLP